MCGIVGIYYKEKTSCNSDILNMEEHHCKMMLEKLRYRGPDEKTTSVFGNTVLGHTRLSIIDLNTGSQPIFNEDKTVAVILNGEIYNYKEIRRQLIKKGHIFKTTSDTEIIVHLYEEQGENLFQFLNGMFAILLYDKRNDVFLAARDRMGEKPILYWETNEKIIFSSEMKALLHHPDINFEINKDALSLYFNSMYVPSPYSIISGINKIQPSYYLKIEGGNHKSIKYWDPDIRIDWKLTEDSVRERFLDLFFDAVNIRKIADVPLGVFLSGGIDSSAITAAMAIQSSSSIKTFSVGFSDEVDERPYARIVAKKYKTDHKEIYISDRIEDIALDVLAYFDEPFGDSSAIPTYLVSREARKFVKVVLTGDGGDELFAGYPSYINQKHLFGNRLITKILKTINTFCTKKLDINYFDRFYSFNGNKRSWEHWLSVRSMMKEDDISTLMSYCPIDFRKFYPMNQWLKLNDKDPMSIAFCHDLNFYLPDDLLKKVDMASMRASLECRAPFLDHRLVEFAMTIPPNKKVKNLEQKYLLKSSLKDIIPSKILNRKKTGFGAPVASWLNNQLKPVVTDLLCTGCKSESYVSRSSINLIKRTFYSTNKHSNFRIPFRLWLLFVFEVWLREYSSIK